MALVAEIKNLQKVLAQVQSRVAKETKGFNVAVRVGFRASYALFVHEMTQRHAGEPRRGRGGRKGRGNYWGPHGQPKFLEQPAREMRGELSEIIKKALAQGKTPAQALLLAGLRLQRESQRLVPVDTGALRASAFTRLELEG